MDIYSSYREVFFNQNHFNTDKTIDFDEKLKQYFQQQKRQITTMSY